MSVLGLAAWLLLASPAELRLAQVVPLDDAVTVTVRQGDQLVWVSEPLRGGQWAAYREVPAGPLTVQCAAGEQHAEGLIDLSAGGRFTLVVHRLLGDPFLLLADPPPTLTSDTTAVRFVQAVPDHDTLWLRWRRPRGTQWTMSPAASAWLPMSGEYGRCSRRSRSGCWARRRGGEWRRSRTSAACGFARGGVTVWSGGSTTRTAIAICR